MMSNAGILQVNVVISQSGLVRQTLSSSRGVGSRLNARKKYPF